MGGNRRTGRTPATSAAQRDIKNEWPSIVANVKSNQAVAAYAGPNHWNDPDMLEVGNSDNGAGPVTDVENQSHFSLWAIAAAPLIAGNNLFDPNMSPTTKTILTNAEIIAINQDAMGLQGVRIWESGTTSLWGKPLNANGARAAVLFNEGAAAVDMTVQFKDLGLSPGSATVRDLQAHADRGSFSDSFTTNVASHGTATLKIVGNEPPRPKGSAFLQRLHADLRRQWPRPHRARQATTAPRSAATACRSRSAARPSTRAWAWRRPRR